MHALHGEDPEAPTPWSRARSTSSLTMTACRNSEEGGLTGSLRSGRRSGISGAAWYRLSTVRIPCRRRLSCRQFDIHPPSRLSKCPRPHLHPVILAGALCVSRGSWRDSWWKCRRSYPPLRCMGLWSRTWTFQFLMVVRGLQGFPGQESTAFVGADRVDIPVPRSGGLQGSRPRQASSASSAYLPGVADEAFTAVFFALFPKRKMRS